jgi:hypothetical protein
VAFSLCCCLSCGCAAEPQNWEAKIPPGTETDPIALNIAFGEKDIPNRDIVEGLKGEYEIKPYSFAGLAPKATNDGIFIVAVKEDSGKWAPPDMAGTGPFHLIKAGTNYYAITERNCARLFGPIEKKGEVLPYLGIYEHLFGDRFADIVTEDTAKDAPEKERKPPKFTRVKELKDGFRVDLVFFTMVHIEAYFETTVHVGRDGVVTEVKPLRMIKKIGEGVRF